ncbi:hypothetical protein Srufu_078910 [Streptomyces libani subsp. rufus]|nr:hypothetical protein Srufu_000070 [Streptomyces libani subsp. rufus]BCK73938.1 hypothetical protein Srufu_078910 [Streptomyces libani subsp. rufus]
MNRASSAARRRLYGQPVRSARGLADHSTKAERLGALELPTDALVHVTASWASGSDLWRTARSSTKTVPLGWGMASSASSKPPARRRPPSSAAPADDERVPHYRNRHD